MRRTTFITILALLAACSSAPKVGTQAPDFNAVDKDGRSFSSAEYTGKVTVYYFWATWCAPCVTSTPAMQRLSDKYGRRADIVAVHYNTVGNAREYYADAGLTMRMVPDGTPIVAAFGVKKIPAVLIVGKDGAVAYSQLGFATADEEKLDRIIAAALGE